MGDFEFSARERFHKYGCGDHQGTSIGPVSPADLRVVNPYMKQTFHGYHLLDIQDVWGHNETEHYIKSYTNMRSNSSPDEEAAIMEDLMCRNLDQRNIVKFLGHCKPANMLVFEPLGCSLHDYLTQNRDLNLMDLRAIRGVVQQVATALEALRSVGVIHGNINPMNIRFVQYKSRPDKLKLTDFSSAVYRKDAESKRSRLNPFYKPPEIRYERPPSEAIDMWGLGNVLALMMTCCPEFEMPDDTYVMTTFIDIPAYARQFGDLTMDWELIDSIESIDVGVVTPISRLSLYEFATVVRGGTAEVWWRIMKCYLLAEAMLAMDPTYRITPKEVLQHPFMSCDIPEPEPEPEAKADRTQTKKKKKNRFLRFFSRMKGISRLFKGLRV